MSLHLQFDPNQEYQQQAVDSVVRLFDGLPRGETAFSLGGEIVPNLAPGDTLDESWLYENLCAVQQDTVLQNDRPLETGMQLETDQGLVLEGAGYESWRCPHFTVEMETGTGKTYVYLRTIYELRARYGFGKFIVVVPSIAIYEGVVKNFEVTRGHFRALYGNETVNLIRYDGAQLSRLRSFATSTFCEIMVMTLDSFNKASNVLYKPTEKLQGELLPYQFLQETRPILILDEPQNMESEKSKEALRTLHPLFALRYSATHRSNPNRVYRLTPFDAYQKNLVKKIQVLGVTEQENFNRPFLALQSVSGTGAAIRATVRTYVQQGGATREQDLVLKQSDDLYAKTKRDEHAGGYVVAEINVGEKWVQFENGLRLDSSAAIGAMRREIFRAQIERTIETHFKTQTRLRARGIKVLSLFFIDRVANYTGQKGIIRQLFDECFDRLKQDYPEWHGQGAAEVQAGYFAQVKGKTGENVVVETRDVDENEKKADERKAEKAAFELIMKAKEQLLGFAEPVSFLFAHSALREGWDNPNVFQICTLNQTISESRKRQEIGRGLRLCVDQSGARVLGDEVNVLTVTANTSYKQYAEDLQKEYRTAGDEEPPSPTDAGKAPARRNEAIFAHKEFRRLWDNLAKPVTPQFNLDTEQLITDCVNRLSRHPFSVPKIVIEQGGFIITRFRLSTDGKTTASGEVKMRLERQDTDGNDLVQTLTIKKGTDLARAMNDERLRGFRVTGIEGEGDGLCVTFGNGIEVEPDDAYEWTSEAGQTPRSRETASPRETYPVGNLLARAAQETGLTRPTLNRIFKAIHPEKAAFLLRNPESFIGTFISEVSNALADHIAQRIVFTPGSGAGTPANLETLFPREKQFTQRELRDAGPKGLYDQVQIDSDNEVSFVEIVRDDTNLVFYFKFPPAFKVALPRQIGNYNPDWGLARLSNAGMSLLYVRETKGSENVQELQWAHEKRKIVCAQKYFAAVGLDYRPVKGTNADWWQTGVTQILSGITG